MLIIIRGCPGSGKSTHAHKLQKYLTEQGQSVAICSNDNYPGYYENAKGVYDWTPERAKLASQYCWFEFNKALALDIDVIILDNTNLSEKSYGKYQREAEAKEHEVSFVEFRPPLDNAVALEEYIQVCASRNKHGVTPGIIREMCKAWKPSSVFKAKLNK